MGRQNYRRIRLASLRGILHAERDSLINLTSGQLEATSALRDVLTALPDDEFDQLLHCQRLAPLGLDALTDAVAASMNAPGLPTRPSQVLITTGTQQALSLLASHHIRPGALVLVEPATSLGALDAFRAAGAHIDSVPPSADGHEIGALLETAAQRQPALIYVIPTYHNVTGRVMPPWKDGGSRDSPNRRARQ